MTLEKLEYSKELLQTIESIENALESYNFIAEYSQVSVKGYNSTNYKADINIYGDVKVHVMKYLIEDATAELNKLKSEFENL